MNSGGTKVGLALVTVVLIATLSMTLSTASVAASDESSVETFGDRVDDVEKLQAARERTIRLIGGGLVLGLGVGTLMGIGVAFGLWRDKL